MQVIRFLIGKGADANAMNKMGETPLSRTAVCGDLELAQLLIDNGAQPNRAIAPDQAPAILAMNCDHLHIVKLLGERGADVTLHLAACLGDVEKTQALLQSAGNLNARDERDRTALYIAACGGHQALAELLIKHGADVHARGEDELTPLHEAARRGHLAVAELLIDSGANVNAWARAHWTPLHEAAWQGHKDVVELLIARGAPVNARISRAVEEMDGPDYSTFYWSFGATPLHLAVKHPEVVKVLIAHGADVTVKNDRDETPAVWASDKQVVDLLIDAGADIDIHLAARVGHAEKVKELIDAGVDVNARDRYGDTPVSLAAVYGHADVVVLLALGGADLDAKHVSDVYSTITGFESPLYRAVELNHVDITRVLVTHGANMNIRDHMGRTLLHMAAYSGHARMVEMLLSHGADPKAKDESDKTPLDYAQEAGFVDIIQLLGGDVAKAKSGPYRAIITDPNEIQLFLDRFMSVDEVWTPDETQLAEFEAALRASRRRNAVLHDDMLMNLRRLHREYAGYTSKGTRYIVCNLVHGDLDEEPPVNCFTSRFSGARSTRGVIFDLDNGTFLDPDLLY
jgi:ankyrin repeat protein